MEIPKGVGGGVQKPIFYIYGTKMEFLEGCEGEGVKIKTFCGRGMDIFWNHTIHVQTQ